MNPFIKPILPVIILIIGIFGVYNVYPNIDTQPKTTPKYTLQPTTPYHPAMPVQYTGPIPDTTLLLHTVLLPVQEHISDPVTLNKHVAHVLATDTQAHTIEQLITTITTTAINDIPAQTGQLPPVFSNTPQNQMSPQ